MQALHSIIDYSWAQSTPLTGLDKSLANLLHSKQPSNDPSHLWLAALTSHQWGRGHACLDLATLQTKPADLLGWTNEQTAALPSHLHEAVATLPWAQGDASPLVLTEDQLGKRLYLRRAWIAEQNIRQNIAHRLTLACKVPEDLQLRLDELFPKAHDDAPDMQRLACEVAAQNRITLITGGPGTGKTTTVVKLLSLLVRTEPHELKIHLAAPTGKAAARLTESISNALNKMPSDNRPLMASQAQTIHRLLQSNNRANEMHQLDTDVVVVDEASMIDLEMMVRLLQAVPPTARLILLGDKDQLASVEAGAVLSQLSMGRLLQHQTVKLIYSHRFETQSGIGQWARAVNTVAANNTAYLQALWKDTPDWLATLPLQQSFDENIAEPDVTRLQLTTATDPKLAAGLRYGWRNWLHLLAAHRPSQTSTAGPCNDKQAAALLDAFTEFCVLCAVREGPMGVTQINSQIEQALGFGQPSAWYSGRPVMVTRNDYALDLMNGDIGMCLPGSDGVLRVVFSSVHGGVRWVMPSRLESVETVFAMTVHKSQGSEFSHVLLVIPAHESPVLTRELVYTGLTRAKKRLTLWVPNLGVLWKGCARSILRCGGLSD